MLRIVLKRSYIGVPQKQRLILEALGLSSETYHDLVAI